MVDINSQQKNYQNFKQADLEELRVNEVNTLNKWEVEAMKGERSFVQQLIYLKEMIDHP